MEADAEARNPYPGLRPFQADETHLFFGRDEQRIELLNRLRRSRFLAITGTSGSGKSSLVRAGLLPGLHGGFMAGPADRWHIVDLRPGTDAMGNLARALDAGSALREQPLAEGEPSFTAATLRRSGLGLVEVIREARLPAGDKVLVLVDQFEELFRAIDASDRPQSSDEASAFVTLLLEAANQPELPIYVVLTMRSDFLGECSRFRGLPEAINDGQYLVPRLTPDQRIQAVTGPAAVFGVKLTSTLVNRLLNDVGENPDQLPILQHALMRTWSRWEGQPGPPPEIDLVDYDAIGGMARALSLHADAVFDRLADHGTAETARRRQYIAEKLFKSLARIGASGTAVRRFARVQEIADVSGASVDEVIAVAEAFRAPGNSFLMPPANEALGAETYLDISHESLIRNWKRMTEWVDDEAESARVYERLSSTALLHEKKAAGLWQEPDLGVALQWRQTQQPNAVWAQRYNSSFAVAMDFLGKSQVRAQAIEDNRARRRRLWIFCVAMLVFVMGTVVASWARQEVGRIDAVLKESEQARERLATMAAVAELTAGPPGAKAAASCSKPEPGTVYTQDLLREVITALCDSKTLDKDQKGEVEVFQAIVEGRWSDAARAADALRDTYHRNEAKELLAGLASTRRPSDRAERNTLIELKSLGGASAAPVRSSWKPKVNEMVHPVHRRIATLLMEDKRGELSRTESKLLEVYEVAEKARLSLSASDLRDDASKSVDELLRQPEDKAYGEIARIALSPESKVFELFEQLTNVLRDYVWSIVLLMIWPAWYLRRLLQRRRGQVIAARANPLRLAAAAVVDILLAVAIGFLVSALTQSALEIVAIVRDAPSRDFSLVGGLLGIGSGAAWLLCRDALKLRFRRSIGKAIFSLRPLMTNGDPPGAVTVGASAKRNVVLPVFLLSSWMLIVAAAAFGLVFVMLFLVGFAIASLVRALSKRPALADRWAKTRVVDSDCAESLSARP